LNLILKTSLPFRTDDVGIAETYRTELIILLIGYPCCIRRFLFRGRVKGTTVTDVFKIALESIWTLLDTSEDNTTRYWREQQARGKLQIAEETKQWANEYKK
jgi:hypothetical protein